MKKIALILAIFVAVTAVCPCQTTELLTHFFSSEVEDCHSAEEEHTCCQSPTDDHSSQEEDAPCSDSCYGFSHNQMAPSITFQVDHSIDIETHIQKPGVINPYIRDFASNIWRPPQFS